MEKHDGNRTFRSITLEGKDIEFSDGFADLHTTSYQDILDKNEFGLMEAKESISLTKDIRNHAEVDVQNAKLVNQRVSRILSDYLQGACHSIDTFVNRL